MHLAHMILGFARSEGGGSDAEIHLRNDLAGPRSLGISVVQTWILLNLMEIQNLHHSDFISKRALKKRLF